MGGGSVVTTSVLASRSRQTQQSARDTTKLCDRSTWYSTGTVHAGRAKTEHTLATRLKKILFAVHNDESIMVRQQCCAVRAFKLTRHHDRQIFHSFFKTLVGKEIAVELKNDVVLRGTLHSVDQYLNVKLLQVAVVDKEKYPQLTTLKSCFIRGSVVRYIQIPPELVDTELLQDAARKENAPVKAKAS